jgi:hypothetical protein
LQWADTFGAKKERSFFFGFTETQANPLVFQCLCFTFPGKLKKKRDVKKRKVRGGTAKIGNTSTLRKVEKQWHGHEALQECTKRLTRKQGQLANQGGGRKQNNTIKKETKWNMKLKKCIVRTRTCVFAE